MRSRREGKRTFYKLQAEAEGTALEFIQLAIRGAKELPESKADQINLRRILARRKLPSVVLEDPRAVYPVDVNAERRPGR